MGFQGLRKGRNDRLGPRGLPGKQSDLPKSHPLPKPGCLMRQMIVGGGVLPSPKFHERTEWATHRDTGTHIPHTHHQA